MHPLQPAEGTRAPVDVQDFTKAVEPEIYGQATEKHKSNKLKKKKEEEEENGDEGGEEGKIGRQSQKYQATKPGNTASREALGQRLTEKAPGRKAGPSKVIGVVRRRRTPANADCPEEGSEDDIFLPPFRPEHSVVLPWKTGR
ncbi:putative double-stranded RNA/RNA-DNA hybrid binding protein [Ceratocystis lukuohia]|uniref:Double-stranded RNA/RNA-DNA hybrid binding protein n=1 Tax=Ceratocystis lukuohia TaxID=2019550 RepID=A0ABR4MTX3_9PEZI